LKTNLIKQSIVTAALLLGSAGVNAEFTGRIADANGTFGQTAGGAMAAPGFAGLRFNHISGFYAGVASVNENTAVQTDTSWQTYAGFSDVVGKELGWDAGVSFSRDPREGASGLMKFYGGVSYKLFSTQLSLANEHLDGDARRTLVEAGFDFRLPEGFDLGVRVGHSRFDGGVGLADYTDYRLTVSKEYAGFGFDFDLTRSGFAEMEDTRYGRLGDSSFNFTVTKSF